MSVSPMKVINIIGIEDDLNRVINILGKSQAFEPEPVTSFYSNTEKFKLLSEVNTYGELLSELDNSLSTANIEVELANISDFKVKDDKLFGYCRAFTDEIDKYTTEIAEKQDEISDCIKNIEQTSHFTGIKIDMKRVKACEYIKPCFGRIPIDQITKLEKYKDNPYIMFFKTAQDNEYYWGVYITPVEEAEEIERVFSGMMFERYDTSNINKTPEEYIQEQVERKKQLEKELIEKQTELKNFVSKSYDEFSKYYTKLTEKTIYQNLKSNVMIYKGNKGAKNSFIICGWLPNNVVGDIEKQLDKLKSVEYQTDDAIHQLKKSPPVKLKNSWFAKPYNFYVEMYGVPKYNEMDPTFFVALTYTILFGAMFGDFGHGIVLAIVGIVMYKWKNMKVGKILVPCGICSSLFGILFGSCFGFEDAFNGMYKALFNLDEKPIDVMGKNIIHIIVASIAVGILLVMVAMCLNIYSSLKQKDMGSALFGSNGVAGLVLYGTACLGIVSLFMFDVNIFNFITIPLLIILPLVLIFLSEPLGKLVEGEKNWKPEKWGDYCTQNGFEMFEVILSYLSNTMSFLRVGAFVMVHAGMMIVVFTLIELVGGIASIGGILVFVIGNLFVIALEGLLVSIQTLRLEFYEMFSRFYSGTGRPYNPVVLKKLNNNKK